MAEKKKNRTVGKALLCGVLVSTAVCLLFTFAYLAHTEYNTVY